MPDKNTPEEVVEIVNNKVRPFFLKLKEALIQAPRCGKPLDYPEGQRYIMFSDTLANLFIDTIHRLEEELDPDPTESKTPKILTSSGEIK